MKRFQSAFFLAVNLLAPVSNVTADDKDVAAILDKAMKALGGEEKLSKLEAVTWKTRGVMKISFQGPERFKFTDELTIAGLDRLKSNKDFGGVKTAARIGFKGFAFNRKQEVIEFKVLRKVDPSSFCPR